MRAVNLQRQAHLLTPGELKRRGITRYDAEIILAHGITLPEPRADTTVGDGGRIEAGTRLAGKRKATSKTLSINVLYYISVHMLYVNNIIVVRWHVCVFTVRLELRVPQYFVILTMNVM